MTMTERAKVRRHVADFGSRLAKETIDSDDYSVTTDLADIFLLVHHVRQLCQRAITDKTFVSVLVSGRAVARRRRGAGSLWYYARGSSTKVIVAPGDLVRFPGTNKGHFRSSSSMYPVAIVLHTRTSKIFSCATLICCSLYSNSLKVERVPCQNNQGQLPLLRLAGGKRIARR